MRWRMARNVNPPVDWSILHNLLLVSLWPLAAILVKRLHDLNLSGWWDRPAHDQWGETLIQTDRERLTGCPP
jgi:hypothetical protein